MLTVFVTYFYFLGLRTLTVIDDTVKLIKKRDPNFDEDTIDITDQKTFEMLSKGNTKGVFQFESAGMREELMALKPNCIEDLIAIISLYRPGPMDSIPQYNKNRHNPEQITYKHPLLKNILDVTYGCIVYQEQVMQIFRELAGFSLGRADLVRRAMSKKKFDVMEKERKNFVYGSEECDGAIKRGVDEKTANEIFDQMLSFASYAFNKSHAAAYAYVSYKTAYLKCHYPVEFMAALMTSVLDNTDKLISYISACSDMGIRVLPPDISHSETYFSVSGNDIRFGLLAIKNLGKGIITSIINSRKREGDFTSFYDFCKRLSGRELNKKAIESLIKSGALDSLGHNRQQMMQGYLTVLERIDSENKRTLYGQTNLFAMGAEASVTDESTQLPNTPEYTKDVILRFEKETIGMFLSGHPVAEYSSIIKNNNFATTSLLSEEESKYNDGDKISILGVITQIKTKNTRSNKTMAILQLEDLEGTVEILAFPNVLSKYESMLYEYSKDDKKSIVVITGTIDSKDEGNIKIICDSVSSPSDYATSTQSDKKLFIKVASNDCYEYNSVLKIINRCDRGNYSVFIRFSDTNALARLNNRISIGENDDLINMLKQLLGDENVATRN